MNDHLQAVLSDHFRLVLIGAAPMVGILLFLLFTLLALRMRARKKSGRMNNADREMTSIGATTWDAYQGPATQGPSTVDPVDPPAKDIGGRAAERRR